MTGQRIISVSLSAIILFVLILLESSTIAQTPEPIFRRYTVDNGLPSSKVYHVFQDSKGYIWFATANGVCRYDGYKFEIFDIQSGLVDNEVFEIYEDYKKRIWFIPLSGKLAYFENGKIVSYKYNNKIKDHLPSSRGPVKCSFYVDSLDYVYLSLKQFGRISISPEGICKKYEGVYNQYSLVSEELKNGRILTSNPVNPKEYGAVVFLGLNQQFKLLARDLNNQKTPNFHHLFMIKAKDNSVFFTISGEIYRIQNGKRVASREFNSDIIWMSVDEENNLWVAPMGGGIYCFSDCDIKQKPQISLLRDVQVSSVLKGSDGAYWFTSLNDGVFYCPDIRCNTYSKNNGLADNKVNAIFANRNSVYVGFEKGLVDLIEDGKIKHFSTTGQFTYSTIHSLTGDTLNNRVWVCSTVSLDFIQDKKVNSIKRTPTRRSVYPRSIIPSRFGGYWIGTTKGLVKLERENVVYESYANNEFSGLIYNLIEDDNGDVWFCTLNGLWKYSKGNYQYMATKHPLLAQPGNDLIYNPYDSCYWISTNGSGIIIYGKDTIHQVTKQEGLASNSIRQLFRQGDVVWAATAQGLSRITLVNSKYSVFNFTIADGLPSNDVTSVFVTKNIVYVGTSKGLSVIDLSSGFKRQPPPNIYIIDLKANNTPLLLTSDTILDYTQNNLSFSFVGLIYRDEGLVQYRHRLLGVDTSWVLTNTPNCNYSGLSYGNYKFEVEAQNAQGLWSLSPAQLSFTISPPYWKKLWFLITISFVFVLLLFFVYRLRVASIKRRNDLLSNINLYKQQSLRQQMNPHFIFNTLNSIQLYILEKDPISSHKYLTKFARLMRMTLDNSLESTIPLKDEIDALGIYLDLEKLRLDGKFEYEINYGDDKSILDYKIPTLLIQPFVENAIWHGIMLKDDQTGWVKIDLVEEGRLIKCTITDNGVGREFANRILQQRNNGHKSRGSQITQQRIDLLNSMYQEKFNIQYEDLYDIDGLSMGTKVHVSIPKEININERGSFV